MLRASNGIKIYIVLLICYSVCMKLHHKQEECAHDADACP